MESLVDPKVIYSEQEYVGIDHKMTSIWLVGTQYMLVLQRKLRAMIFKFQKPKI